MLEDPLRPDVPRTDALPPSLAAGVEDICPHCGGAGERDGSRCEHCAGTGWVIEPRGGA
jgi:DnaJ-class molecular chaperone